MKATPRERPLDDGPRDGTETWRVVDGITFCHWDRWLLRLAVSEIDGLDGVLRHVSRGRHAEELLAQIADLRLRFAQIRRTPSGLLEPVERHSEWLRKKAEKRVLRDGPHRKTEAMRRTPQRVLQERALRGHHAAFAVSPLPYEHALSGLIDGYEGWRATGVAMDVVVAAVRSLAPEADPPASLAAHRAALTVILAAHERFDDSIGEIADAFRQIERAYLTLLRPHTASAPLLCDLVEFTIWEDYGLSDGVESFLAALRGDKAAAAKVVVKSVLAELEGFGLDYQAGKARKLSSALE